MTDCNAIYDRRIIEEASHLVLGGSSLLGSEARLTGPRNTFYSSFVFVPYFLCESFTAYFDTTKGW